MVNVQPSTPFDLCESRIGDRAAGIFFLLLAAGAFFLAWSGIIELPVDMADFPLELAGSAFGAILTYMGLSVVFTLKGFRVDPVAKTIRRFRRGVFGRRYDPEIPLEDLDHLRFTHESIGVGRAFYTLYFHKQTGEELRVVGSDRFRYARHMAERFARALNLDLHDDSDSDKTRARKPDELDESVRDKLRKTFSHRSSPSIPSYMRPKIQRGIDRLIIEIPHFLTSQLGPIQKVIWISLIAMAGGIAASFYYWGMSDVAWFAVPVSLVFCYLLLRSETIVVSSDTLSVSTGIGALKIKRSIPLDELEELHLTNLTAEERKDLDALVQDGEVPQNMRDALAAFVSLGSAIVASSDRKKITIGRILSHAELDVVLYELESRVRQ